MSTKARIETSVPLATKARLDKAAKKKKISRAQLLRDLIKKAVKDHC